ncbi:DNA polymerase II large subunit-like protein [Diplocarpon rosae]|nr:DNA polymerase II large subunit-like protein [Diplocarpon rosae]
MWQSSSISGYEVSQIFIANPFHKIILTEKGGCMLCREEALSEDDMKWAMCFRENKKLLEQLVASRHDFEKKHIGKLSKTTVTKALNAETKEVGEKLLNTAIGLGLSSTSQYILGFDSCGRLVANQVFFIVIAPNLPAKVDALLSCASTEPNMGANHLKYSQHRSRQCCQSCSKQWSARTARPIRIFTRNFDDLADFKTVLHELKDLGIVEKGKQIYYKCELKYSNVYKIAASMYSSDEILDMKPGVKDRNLKDFLHKPQKQTRDYRYIDLE